MSNRRMPVHYLLGHIAGHLLASSVYVHYRRLDWSMQRSFARTVLLREKARRAVVR